MIKQYTENDYSLIYDIWERSVAATHDFLAQEDFDFYKEKVPHFFPMVTLYVDQEADGIIKGFLGVTDDGIDMLFVDANYLGQGIGKNLLLFAIDELKIKKVDVNQQNTRAFDFYKKYGFKEIGISEVDDFGKQYPILYLEL